MVIAPSLPLATRLRLDDGFSICRYFDKKLKMQMTTLALAGKRMCASDGRKGVWMR